MLSVRTLEYLLNLVSCHHEDEPLGMSQPWRRFGIFGDNDQAFESLRISASRGGS